MQRAPEAPDPNETAAAQTASNRDTAITQQQLNMVNQVNPWGSVNYNQTGTRTYTDADGNVVSTPSYTQTTTLSPSQQAIFNQSQRAQGNLAGIAADQSGFLRGYLGQRMDTSSLPQLQGGLGRNYDQTFNQNLGLQTNAGLQNRVGAGYATSYAGADDFSADRKQYEDALWARGASDRTASDASLRTTLAQKGIKEGSAAWNSEMERMGRQNTDARLATMLASGQEQSRMVGLARDAATFGNSSLLAQMGAENAARLSGAQFGNDARATQGQFGLAAQQAQNNAALTGANFNNAARSQGMQEMFALRNQPINEITALLSGTQVNAPGQMSSATPTTGVAGTDVAGIRQQGYQNQLNAYQSGMGGLFGLGGSLLGAAGNAGGFGALFSDARLKEDIRRVGQTDGGVPLYSYRYVWGGPVQIGVMAHDVPEAATLHESGYLMVDYGKVH